MRALRPRPARVASVRLGLALGLGAFSIALVGARAEAAGTAGQSPTALARRAPEAPPLDQRWRARGVAFVDLPLGLRARYDAQTLLRPAPGNPLEAAFLDRPTATGGRSRLLESRFTLSHAVAHHVELELSWAARSPLTAVDLLRIEDQRVAAMIRFVP